jgi:hypothetical protein
LGFLFAFCSASVVALHFIRSGGKEGAADACVFLVGGYVFLRAIERTVAIMGLDLEQGGTKKGTGL